MRAVTTPDFVIFEDGKAWNNDSLINLIKTFPSFKIDYKFDNLIIHIDDSIGNMHYFNPADMVMNDTIKMAYDWIESAAFVKDSVCWKMTFLHTTVQKEYSLRTTKAIHVMGKMLIIRPIMISEINDKLKYYRFKIPHYA